MALANRDDAALASLDAEIENRACRERLLPYVLKTSPDYIAERIHRQVASVLEALARREITRLMVTAHPRSGKTALISQRFPVWYLSQPQHYTHQIIHAGYGSEIVEDAGRELRNLLSRAEHLDVFPSVRLAGDSRAANHWKTTTGGTYVAAGTGGAIVGRGADAIILDDVTKGDAEAHSPTIQDQTWRWYVSDLLSRRHKDSVMVVVGRRWTDVDLMGRLLAEMDAGGPEFTHLHYPAIAEDGTACAPSRIPLEQLQETRRTVPARVWNSLWQGNPVPAEGAFFPASGLIEYEPEELSIIDPHTKKTITRPMVYYGASDFAVTPGGGDFTVHMVVGVDPLDNIYIMDLWRKQAGPAEGIDSMISMMETWQPRVWVHEKGVIDKSIGPFMTKRMQERKAYFHMVRLASARDKEERCQSILGRVSMGKVRFPKHQEFWPGMQNELIRFPHGKHDDQVDALALIGRVLHGMVGGLMPDGAAAPGRILSVGGKPTPGYNLMTYDDLLAEEESLRPRRRRRR